MSPEQYMAKAARALESAAALFGKGDFEGSVNRAYYAMFHAARGALASRNVEIKSRKHGALVGNSAAISLRTVPYPRRLAER